MRVIAYGWKKNIGSDVIIRLEDKIIANENTYDGTIIISEGFSENARDVVGEMNKKKANKIMLLNLSDVEEINKLTN